MKVLETGVLDHGRIYVAMEYLKKGSLEDEASGGYIKLTRAKRLMIDTLRALEYVHSKEIVHRDVKPANILIGDASEGKLSDFGLAIRDITKVKMTSFKGYQYMSHLAPEVNNFDDYSYLSDIYACGVTLYRLVNGDNYLPQVNTTQLRNEVVNGKYPNRDSYRYFIPRSLKLIMNKAMNIDPSKRFQSAESMRHALEQVEIAMDWEESVFTNGNIWRSKRNSMRYEVSLILHKNKKWSVNVKKGKNEKSLRRISKFSANEMSKTESRTFVKRILQNFTTGKLS